ncbi:MurR/RpiR family transcriptional regulator [Nocardia sp. NPDC052278]|uniref:MurR/RpiR family transcriptional regulator n=1 Tax=unclassified Nocardia TaxID=2637762 RepID=UPI0036B267DB
MIARLTVQDSAPTTYQELRALLQQRLPELADGQQRIARLVLDDPEGTAFRSIGQSAELAGVHRSSLVRFATMLGLPGYPGLVELCRRQLAAEAYLVRRPADAPPPSSNDEFFTAITEYDANNMSRTFARIDRGDWDRAVETLAQASTVHVIGLRRCLAIAYAATYQLQLVRHRVRQLGATARVLTDELRDIEPGDALIAVSIRRYSSDTVRAVESARRRGATTIALTDDASSPLARIADVTFYAGTGSLTVLRSLTAFTGLVHALVTAVAMRLGSVGTDTDILDDQLLD